MKKNHIVFEKNAFQTVVTSTMVDVIPMPPVRMILLQMQSNAYAKRATQIQVLVQQSFA